MPVTKTAKRALRVSKRKALVNKDIIRALEVSLRNYKTKKTKANFAKLASLADRAAKRGIIHKNKADRIKSRASKLLTKSAPKPKK